MLHPQTNPTEVPTFTLPESFEGFPLAPVLMRGLQDAGFARPTEIQARALPIALQGRDLMASAQTGTGKTAAFALPALQRLLSPPPAGDAPGARRGRGPRVLVLTPTRELAGQVEGVIRQLGRHTRLRMGVVVGGVSYGPQESLLRAPLDVLVATPGRLIDHMERGLVEFSRLELFVLDEADRMLDLGFVKPVMRIAAALPAVRQTLLFSATLEGGVQDISRKLLRNPERIQLASVRVRHDAIRQRLQLAQSPEHKHALLTHLLADPALTQAIVFTATKRGADKLAKRLASGGLACAAMHGNMRQNARNKTLDALRKGRLRVLVATDVAARGIDVLGISHVINFDLPTVAEDYIHRIGRTGRNGATGEAISLVGPQDRVKLNAIERLTGLRLVRENVQGVPVAPVAALAGAQAAPQMARPALHAVARPSEPMAAATRRPTRERRPLRAGRSDGGPARSAQSPAPRPAASHGQPAASFTPAGQRRSGRARGGQRSSW